VVVFRLPRDDSTDYIKRVIGLPGDRIQNEMTGLLYINGTAGQARACKRIRRRRNGAAERVRRWRETLPNGVPTRRSTSMKTDISTTPGIRGAAGHYFHDGRQSRQLDRQSRPRSARVSATCRSRTSSARPRSSFFSIGDGEPAWHIWSWPWSVRWSRLFTIVR